MENIPISREVASNLLQDLLSGISNEFERNALYTYLIWKIQERAVNFSCS